MAEHLWSVLCHKASIDRDSNVVSLLEVAESFEIGGIPKDAKVVVPLNLELVSFWTRSKPEERETATSRYWLVEPDGTRFSGGESTIDLTTGGRSRTIVRMNGLPLTGPGVYTFNVDLKGPDGRWMEVAKIPLEVTYAANGTPPIPARAR